MDIKEFADRVERLQEICKEIYFKTITFLQVGMTEVDIALRIRDEFKKKRINSFWYNIPISVLLGEQRFLTMVEKDYKIKSPSAYIKLRKGNPVHIDMAPMDSKRIWGDFSATCIFKPNPETDYEKVNFLKLVQKIQREG